MHNCHSNTDSAACFVFDTWISRRATYFERHELQARIQLAGEKMNTHLTSASSFDRAHLYVYQVENEAALYTLIRYIDTQKCIPTDPPRYRVQLISSGACFRSWSRLMVLHVSIHIFGYFHSWSTDGLCSRALSLSDDKRYIFDLCVLSLCSIYILLISIGFRSLKDVFVF